MPRSLSLLLAALTGCASAPSDEPEPMGSSTGLSTPGDGSSGSGVADGSGSSGSLDGSTGEAADPDPWLCPDDPDLAPRFELGWDYKDGWIDLEPGGPVVITIGGQGAWMIPLGVRGEGFCVPVDRSDYDNVPPLDIVIEAEDEPEPVAAVRDFPVSFEPIDAGDTGDTGEPGYTGVLGYTFIPMMIADGLDVEQLEGQATTIRAELRPRDVPPLEFTLEGTLTLSH